MAVRKRFKVRGIELSSDDLEAGNDWAISLTGDGELVIQQKDDEGNLVTQFVIEPDE